MFKAFRHPEYRAVRFTRSLAVSRADDGHSTRLAQNPYATLACRLGTLEPGWVKTFYYAAQVRRRNVEFVSGVVITPFF
jgi:hypothetical protein